MSDPNEARTASAQHLPGEAGVWMFIVGDLVIFTLLFAVFLYYRADNVPLFTESQRTLNQTYGAVNTLLLLSSSWFVALAVQGARIGERLNALRLIALAFGCGVGFIGIKYLEYSEKFRAGYNIVTNDFFMYYFLTTGIHLVHVAIGMAVLAFLWHTTRGGEIDAGKLSTLESGASFWHLVDILWIALFALLYMLR